MKSACNSRLLLLAPALVLLAAPALRAQSFSFPVSLNLATLNSQDGAHSPFDLDFQLNGGNGAATNTVTIGGFSFLGGNALGSPTTTGTASGSLTSGVSLIATPNSANELFQQFSAATTNIQFTVTVTENAAGSIPTEFTAAILDNSLGSPAQLFTTAPDTASLVTLNLGASNSQSDVGYFTSVSSADGNTSVVGVSAAVPEPSTTAAMFGAVAILAACCVRRFGRRAPAAAPELAPRQC